MSMIIKGDTFTTFDDLWETSNLTQAEKDEIQLNIALAGKLIETDLTNEERAIISQGMEEYAKNPDSFVSL